MSGNTGLVHIYHGDGKGKSTAACGLALRCAGGGGKVLYYQFMKSGKSGEISLLKQISGIKVLEGRTDSKFSFQMSKEEKRISKEYYMSRMNEIKKETDSNNYNLLVLDEALHAVNNEFVPLEMMLEFLANKPDNLEVVLTGRNPGKELTDIADYVTLMKKEKHPFDKGIGARLLIEE